MFSFHLNLIFVKEFNGSQFEQGESEIVGGVDNIDQLNKG